MVHRVRITVCGGVLGLILTLVAGVGIARAGSPCQQCSGLYSGSWNATLNASNDPSPGTTTTTISLTWSATLHWDAAAAQNVWTLGTAKGTVSVSGSPNGMFDCSGTLSPGPGAVLRGEAFWVSTSQGIGSSPNTGFATYWTVAAQPPVLWDQNPAPGDPLRESGGAAGTQCASAGPLSLGLEGIWSANLGGPQCDYDNGTDWVAFPVGTSLSSREVCTSSGTGPSGSSWTATLNTDRTLDSPSFGKHGSSGGVVTPHGRSGGGVSTPPKLTSIKADQQKDFAKAWDDAKGPCAQVAMGLGVTATGAVWMSASATVPGGIPAGGAVIATGDVMTSVSTQLCAPKLKRLIDDYRIFKDPPDSHYTQLVRIAARTSAPPLRACRGLSGKVRTFCLRLAPLVADLVAASSHTAAVDDALLTTVNRASSANRAHNTAALSAQLNHATALEGQFRNALRDEAAIGRSIRRLVPAGNLTAQQSAATDSYLSHQLSRKGISSSEIGQIDSGASSAAAIDPIARLVSP